jgi:hypothetical protein
MFEEIISKEQLIESLNTDYTYHFVLMHPKNCHISTIETPKLMLIGVRDRLNNFNLIDDVELDYPCIVKPTQIETNILDIINKYKYYQTFILIYTNNKNEIIDMIIKY